MNSETHAKPNKWLILYGRMLFAAFLFISVAQAYIYTQTNSAFSAAVAVLGPILLIMLDKALKDYKSNPQAAARHLIKSVTAYTLSLFFCLIPVVVFFG